jgi:hypothetical protein
MEDNQKPEWFELAENDQPVNRPLKSKKSAPMRNLAFILAGILVIPMGAGVALLTHDSKSATAVETLNLTQDSPAAKAPAAITPPGSASTDIILPPTKKGDDDDDDEDDDDEDDD